MGPTAAFPPRLPAKQASGLPFSYPRGGGALYDEMPYLYGFGVQQQ